MTHDELLDYLREHEEYWTSLRANRWDKVPAFNALRAVVELPKETNAKELNLPTPHGLTDKEKKHFFYEQGYATAMNKVIQAIEKELK